MAQEKLNLLQFPGLNHKAEITKGVREEECRQLLLAFFAEQRERNEKARAAGRQSLN